MQEFVFLPVFFGAVSKRIPANGEICISIGGIFGAIEDAADIVIKGKINHRNYVEKSEEKNSDGKKGGTPMIIIKDVQKIFLREPGIPVDECILADDRWEERMPHYMFCPYNGKSVLQDWSLFDKLTDMLFEITDDEGFIRDILLAMKKDVGYKKLINYIRATPDITKEKIVWYSKNWKKWL